MSPTLDGEAAAAGLGRSFSILGCYLKPYPSCRHTHCGVQAVSELRPAIDAPIRQINISIYSNAISIAGQIRHPRTPEEAKFSIYYAVACMAAKGRFGLAEIESAARDREVEAMIDRITLIPDEAMENRGRGIRGCEVENVRRV